MNIVPKSLSAFVSWSFSWLCRMTGTAFLPFTGEYYGLGNRVKGICNFYSRGFRRFVLLWNTESWVTDSFWSLFEIEGVKVISVENGWLYRIVNCFFRRFMPCGIVREECPFWSFILPERLCLSKYRHRWHFALKESFSIDWRFHDIDKEIVSYFLPFFKALKPSARVWKRIALLPDIQRCVGVQIRNSGLVADEKEVASIESIALLMEKYPDNTIFFISAMNGDVASRFKNRFGCRIQELPNKDYHSMVDSVADMWLLGHCKEMIASPSSTFSEVAWWWGMTEGRVSMLRPEYNQRDVDK